MRGLLLSSIKYKQPPVAGELLALQGAAGQHGAEWAATIGAKITEMAITKTVVMEATGILNIWSGKGGNDGLRHRKRCSELVIDTTIRCHYAFGSQRRATPVHVGVPMRGGSARVPPARALPSPH